MRVKFMKYRTKLYLSLVSIALISVLIGLSISYFKVKEILFTELQSEVISIASSTASAVDSVKLAEVISESTENSLAYTDLQNKLRLIRNVNRRPDTYVKYVYILAPAYKNSESFNFIVDAEEPTSSDFSHIKENATEADYVDLNLHLHEYFSPNNFIVDKWGTWLVGYAPIYDAVGNYVATLGVNISAQDINGKLQQLLILGIISFVVSVILALLIGFMLSKRATISLRILQGGVKNIANGDFTQEITIATHDEFNELAQEINAMAKGLEERERLKLNFSRYVSQSVMELILKSDGGFKLEGERRKVTMLFSDIRQFTKLSESLNPEQVVSLLNEYFEVMVDVVFKYKGMLDKFLGDGMMAEFGAPLEDGEQELHAVQAAIEMQIELEKLCDRWEQEGNPRIKIGIGIHCGESVIGNIGSEKHIEYTAIGDTVNVASRLQELTKELHSSIVVSEAVVNAVGDKIAFKKVGPMALRGRVDPIIVYTLI